jgi:hypothetical protein
MSRRTWLAVLTATVFGFALPAAPLAVGAPPRGKGALPRSKSAPPRGKTDLFANFTRPSEVHVRLGPHEVLMESGHQGLIHFPDEPICILNSRPLKFLMVSGDSTYLMQGASWATSVPLAKVLTPGPAGSVDNNYAGVSSVYLDKPNRRWIGFYHAEDREGIDKIEVTGVQGFYGTICAGESPQDATEVRKLGPAITADKPKLLRGWETEGGPREAWLAQGVGVPSVCPSADGKYLMCWYGEWSNRIKRGVQICVARSPIESAGLPGSWKKYYQGAFSEPGIGGHETPVVAAAPGVADTCDPHVQYVREWDRYVMVFGAPLYSEVLAKPPRAVSSGLFLSTSQDGLAWNKPVRLEVVFPLVIVTQRCKVHPMLLVTHATSQRLRGFLLYGFTPEWPTVPHHLGGCPIDVTINQKSSDGREPPDGNRATGVIEPRVSPSSSYRKYDIRFDKPDVSSQFVFSNQNGRAYLRDSELRITSPDPWEFRGGGHATFRTSFTAYRSVRIIGRIVKPSSHEFRFCVGQLNGIILWQGAENEHHFRVANGPKEVKTDRVVIPGERVEIVVEQTRNDTATVRVNGTTLFSAKIRLEGSVTVYTAGNEIAVQEIQVEGIPNPRQEAREVPLEYLW